MDKNFAFNFPVILKSDSKGEFYLEGYAATTSLDRQDEVILKTALEKALEDIKENKTVFYEHKSTEYPVGKIVDAKIIDEEGMSKLYIKVYISKTAETVRTLIEEGILNKFSIGGKVLKYKKADMGGKEITEIQDMELYEVSVVGLPANVKAETIGFEIKKSLELNLEKKEEVKVEKVEEKKEPEVIVTEVKVEEKVEEKPVEKSATSYQDLPMADLAMEWDSTGADARVRAWAGGDDKEKIDWVKYGKAFMYYDAKDKENFGSYKLPYADVIGGELKAVAKAIYSIKGAISGARGGVDIPAVDKDTILNQCERYQKKIDEMKPKEETKQIEEVEVLDAAKVMTALTEIKDLLTQVLESTKNIKVEIKKEELPVQKVEASIKPEEVEAAIKKAVEAVKEEFLKTIKIIPTRKGLVIQESPKDEPVIEKTGETTEDPITVLEDEKKFKELPEKEQKEIIRKGFLSILQRAPTED